MNEHYKEEALAHIQTRLGSITENLNRQREEQPQPPSAETIPQYVEGAIVDPDERRANAVNVVLHAKGIQATVTRDDAAAIWRIVLELETISS